jgi:hypothetical protein
MPQSRIPTCSDETNPENFHLLENLNFPWRLKRNRRG